MPQCLFWCSANAKLVELIKRLCPVVNPPTRVFIYVNIFHKYNHCITTLLSTLYKTYCFTFQKRLFCTVKA
ncbi:hypothetical protein CTM58_07480 [Prevotella intermedia]|uniref:Uncharacterized protein n=1 Tax=Prevotella intermedia TaxID=28131 RepID=A0A2M8TVG0_PREIN|nr:hypothetical protein CTM58_07480 [Prevotella intermedia]